MTSRASSPSLKRVPPCRVPFCDAVDRCSGATRHDQPLSQSCPHDFSSDHALSGPTECVIGPACQPILGSSQRPMYRLACLDRIGDSRELNFLLRPFRAALECIRALHQDTCIASASAVMSDRGPAAATGASTHSPPWYLYPRASSFRTAATRCLSMLEDQEQGRDGVLGRPQPTLPSDGGQNRQP